MAVTPNDGKPDILKLRVAGETVEIKPRYRIRRRWMITDTMGEPIEPSEWWLLARIFVGFGLASGAALWLLRRCAAP